MTNGPQLEPSGEQGEPIRAALAGAAVYVARPEWGTLRVAGPDRIGWLNGIVTCDVAEITPQRGAWGLLLSKQGKIEAELQLLAAPDSLVVGVCGAAAADVAATLDRYLVMEDAEVEALGGLCWWELHGRRAAEVALACRAHATAAGAMTWTAAGSAALVVPSDQAGLLEQALREQGALGVSSVAWEPERIRLGLPRASVDFGREDNPHAAGLERRAVSWSKGCYLGQEVVCMQDMRGKVKRRLVRLELEAGSPAPLGGSDVLALPDRASVGVVKSQAGKYALASLRAPADAPGTRVSVGETAATVHPLELGELQG